MLFVVIFMLLLLLVVLCLAIGTDSFVVRDTVHPMVEFSKQLRTFLLVSAQYVIFFYWELLLSMTVYTCIEHFFIYCGC